MIHNNKNCGILITSKSVMDALWNDDPEELLLELGFGVEEPDLSGRIPARFINYRSLAKGINLQVFLEAQKSRIDVENPDVSSRFRQIEVLQQVTTTLCSFVASTSSMSPEAREKRRRVVDMFRRASKKSLGQIHQPKTTGPTATPTPASHCAAPESPQPTPDLGDNNAALQRVPPGPLENVCASPPVEEREADPAPQLQPHAVSSIGEERALRHGTQPSEMEEALPGLSEGNTGSRGSEQTDSTSSPPPRNSSSHFLSPAVIDTGGDTSLLSSPCPPPEAAQADAACSEMATGPDRAPSPPASLSGVALEHLPPWSSSPEIQSITHSQSPPLPSPAFSVPLSPKPSLTRAPSFMRGSEDVIAEDEDAPWPHLPSFPLDSEGISCPTFSSVPPSVSPPPPLDSPIPACIAMSTTQPDAIESPGNKRSEWTERVLRENTFPRCDILSSPPPSSTYVPSSPPLDCHCPSPYAALPLIESGSQSTENKSKYSVLSYSDGSGLFKEPNNLFSRLGNESSSDPSPPALDSLKFEDSCPPLPDTFIPVCLSATSSSSHPDPDLSDPAAGRIIDLTEQSVSQKGQSHSLEYNTDFIPSSSVKVVAEVVQLSLDSEDRHGEAERGTETLHSINTAVFTSVSDSPANLSEGSGLSSDPKETDPHILSRGPWDEISAETQREEFREVCQMEIDDTERESPGSYLVLHPLPEIPSRTEVALKHLIERAKLYRPASLPAPDSFKFPDGCPTLAGLSRETFDPVCRSATSSPSHPGPDLTDPAAGRTSDPKEQPCFQRGGWSSRDDSVDFTPSPGVRDVVYAEAHLLSLDLEDRLEEAERYSETVHPLDTVVFISDSESLSEGSRFGSYPTETDPQVLSCGRWGGISAEAEQEQLEEVSRMQINDAESEASKRDSVLRRLAGLRGRTEIKPKHLIETESLDVAFETSVDSTEDENGDLDAFFQQLDNEGRVYWAEPIQVINPKLRESDSFEVSDGEGSLSPSGSTALDSIPSMDEAMALFLPPTATLGTDQDSRNAAASRTPDPFLPLFGTTDPKQSGRSVSVQMPSFLSSHIVHRKDVPYVADSKRSLLPSVFPLDTSSPFRAVQAWTDVQIQRNIKKCSRWARLPVTRADTGPAGASERTKRSALIYSSSPSFPLLSHEAHCLPGMVGKYRTVSASVDTGLGPEKEEEVDRNAYRDQKNLWAGHRPVTMACCCSCDHQCSRCSPRNYSKRPTLGDTPYSLGELEEMTVCLQQFRSMHSNMEEQLSEDRASVYSDLSDQDRETIQDLEVLRQAMKHEARELETQLKELAHHHDDSMKNKMHRLLDEQSLLCSQLRVFPPGAAATSSGPNPSRTVATQCYLLPSDTCGDHVPTRSTGNMDSPPHSPAGSECLCKGCSPTSRT